MILIGSSCSKGGFEFDSYLQNESQQFYFLLMCEHSKFPLGQIVFLALIDH